MKGHSSRPDRQNISKKKNISKTKFKKGLCVVGGVAQVVELLPSKHAALDSIPRTKKRG
jgi:hypothetical protein